MQMSPVRFLSDNRISLLHFFKFMLKIGFWWRKEGKRTLKGWQCEYHRSGFLSHRICFDDCCKPSMKIEPQVPIRRKDSKMKEVERYNTRFEGSWINFRYLTLESPIILGGGGDFSKFHVWFWKFLNPYRYFDSDLKIVLSIDIDLHGYLRTLKTFRP